MNRKNIDPWRIAIALAMIGSFLIAGISMMFSESPLFYLQVAGVSFGILLALGYLIGFIYRELYLDYRTLQGSIYKKEALKTPIAARVDFRPPQTEDQVLEEEALDIDYESEKEKEIKEG
ncbi:hypothetical protein [Chrysiogenes arsenatis]|uniref:hypothetical protein n=1 Tax=Chrysiogenes arsenatis TaxID=309797 RepID=UPI00042716B8|nr:hypothetical protein [Chrysiogenes arsenatis]